MKLEKKKNNLKKVYQSSLKLKNKIELKKKQQQEDTQPRHFIKKNDAVFTFSLRGPGNSNRGAHFR